MYRELRKKQAFRRGMIRRKTFGLSEPYSQGLFGRVVDLAARGSSDRLRVASARKCRNFDDNFMEPDAPFAMDGACFF